MVKKCLILVWMFLGAVLAQGSQAYIHHDMVAGFDPAGHSVHVEDRIRIPDLSPGREVHFLLHGNLKITSHSDNIELRRVEGDIKDTFAGINTAEFQIPEKLPVAHYAVSLSATAGPEPVFTLVYEGVIHHPVEHSDEEYARSFSETPGIIDAQGIYLSGSSFWVPWFGDHLVTFRVDSRVPAGWDTVSQGKRTIHQREGDRQRSVWDSPEPMDEIYLVAGPFTTYERMAGSVAVMAFLRKPDPALAGKYLETTGQYLRMYEQLIGPYPYGKFALVENFWETGYGMPSFTLLGPQIIRFPFILHSSYPHELLHNWWGNSVFVDYDRGNWCEGLTAYLADHLIQEQRGQGEAYRKTALQNFTDYVDKKGDIPLNAFRARHDSASSAVGYGKSMMLEHMLRLMVGDTAFRKSLQHFYRERQFTRATFDDIRRSFEAVTGKDLGPFFRQWVDRPGAPTLKLGDVEVQPEDKGYRLSLVLEQVQAEDPFRIRVPVAVTLDGAAAAQVQVLDMDGRQQRYDLRFDRRPVRLDVDPGFDVFRRLDVYESAPTLSGAFGSRRVLIILPSSATPEMRAAYQTLARDWAGDRAEEVEVRPDSEVTALPADRAVWIFGRTNVWRRQVVTGAAAYGVHPGENGFTVGKKHYGATDSVVVAVRHPANPAGTLVWLVAGGPAAVPGLGRKLPHYGKYSFLAFEGDEPTNVAKEQWPVLNSPLSWTAAKKGEAPVATGRLPARPALAGLPPVFSAESMMDHVRFLADPSLAGRGLGSPELDRAAEYIAAAFRKAGLRPGGDNGSFFQVWKQTAGPEGKEITLRNVVAILPGRKAEFAGQAVVVGAHYDHLGRGWPDVHTGDEGKIHPGADDNASGVAVLLELARRMADGFSPDRDVVFVAFTGEESGRLGSRHFVRTLSAERKRGIMAAINLDTVGRLGERKLLVLGGNSAREWKFIFMGIGYTTGVETDLVVQDLDASDQISFLEAGIPAIQLFAGPNADYHRPSDTAERIDPAGLVKTAVVTDEAVRYLVAREEPLSFAGTTAPAPAPSAARSSGGRRVRTGVMPDFAFSGSGVRIGQVDKGSPADTAGLRPGDVIVRLNRVAVTDLRSYSQALAAFAPGDRVELAILRDGRTLTVNLVLAAR